MLCVDKNQRINWEEYFNNCFFKEKPLKCKIDDEIIKGYCNDCKVVQLEYDHTRRYFMTPIYNRYDKVPPMQRVSRDVFENNVKYLLDKGYTLSF
jgi:hypothetical protein